MSKEAEDGWGSLYYHVMPQLISATGCKVGAEIGVAFGGHSEAILKHTQVEKLYSIDPYTLVHPNTDGYTTPDGKFFEQKDYEALYIHALHRCRKYNNRSVFIREDSHAAWALVEDELDFVFIDARHTYADVYTDIYLWEKRVKKGGIIAGHDYGHPSYDGIKRAVDKHFDNVNVEDGYVWWTFKK